MRIQFTSDLHFESKINLEHFTNHPLTGGADVLVLAGDIVEFKKRKFAAEVFADLQAKYPVILEISGNHEFYGTQINAPQQHDYGYTDGHYRVNNNTFELNGIRFVCSILWSFIPPENRGLFESRLNDYHQILDNEGRYPITTKDTNRLHNEAVDFLSAELNKPFAGKTVTVTHHMPSEKCIIDKWQGNKFTAGYASNCEDLIPLADYWIFGHQHANVDFDLEGCRMLANPLGYVETEDQYKHWRPDWVIEI